jgi:hypothetical protein
VRLNSSGDELRPRVVSWLARRCRIECPVPRQALEVKRTSAERDNQAVLTQLRPRSLDRHLQAPTINSSRNSNAGKQFL